MALSFQISRPAAKRISPLLLQGLCTRAELFDTLSLLEYHDGPEAVREVDGYLILPERAIDLRDVGAGPLTIARLEHLAFAHKLRGRKGSKQKSSLALDAILTDLIVPTDGRSITDILVGLRDLEPIPRTDPPSSYRARMGITRSNGGAVVQPGDAGEGLADGDGDNLRPPAYILRLSDRSMLGWRRLGVEEADGIMNLSRLISRMTRYRLTVPNGGDTLPAVPRRRRHDVHVHPWVIEHYAREGLRLNLTPAVLGKGGIRTPLSIAGWVVELIGLGYVAPSHLILMENRTEVMA